MDASHASKRSREPSSVLPGLGAVAADDVPNRFHEDAYIFQEHSASSSMKLRLPVVVRTSSVQLAERV